MRYNIILWLTLRASILRRLCDRRLVTSNPVIDMIAEKEYVIEKGTETPAVGGFLVFRVSPGLRRFSWVYDVARRGTTERTRPSAQGRRAGGEQ